MPRPAAGTGQTSALRAALCHPEQAVKEAFIVRIVQSYRETRDLSKTAAVFGCNRRTLERAIVSFPALGEAIEAERVKANIIP